MDFYNIETRYKNREKVEVYPDFIVKNSGDLMVKGGRFYAVYDKSTGMWSTDKMLIQKAVDYDIDAAIIKLREEDNSGLPVTYIPKYLKSFSSNYWINFERYVTSLADNFKQLDPKVSFLGDLISKKDYVSKQLPYSLYDGPCPAWDEIVSTLYDPEEREKIEWAIGAMLTGEAKKIQKFFVFYGKQGSGKSTILNIIMKLFEGYYATFKAENLIHDNDQFGLKFLSSNPLVAIDGDTKLKKIESNATLNKIASHEEIEVNEKYKSQYVIKPMCMMLLATNSYVQITDAKSGIIRRMIDIEPNREGRKIEPESYYFELMDAVNNELGAIAQHCINVFMERKRYYYNGYIPIKMMYRTDPFFNFMQEQILVLMQKQQDDIAAGKELDEGISANNLWAMWKDYCTQSGIEFTKKRFEIIDEASNYFDEYIKFARINDGKTQVRNWLKGFKFDKFEEDQIKKSSAGKNNSALSNKIETIVKPDIEKVVTKVKEPIKDLYSCGWLKFDQKESLLDKELADQPAQYEVTDEKTGQQRPMNKWVKCKTKLKDLDTTKVHFVKSPAKLITIDFDYKNAKGEKDMKANMKAASKWPPTYAELSKSGGGIHLEYWYDGDPNELSSYYDEYIEVKVYPEDKDLTLRRRLSLCNDLPIAHISGGLQLKEKKKVINYSGLKDEQHLRNLIIKAVKGEIEVFGASPKTITCIKYISDILKEAQEKDMPYDIRDMENFLYSFAASSHNSQKECLDIFYQMELLWPKEKNEPTGDIINSFHKEDSPIIILDCEVVQNLTLVVYKELEPDGVAGILKSNGPIKKCIRLYNPTCGEIEKLINSTRIVGHNVTGYDNFVLYAKYLGWDPEQVAQLSQEIINGNARNKLWRDAKNISWTDTLDVSSEKKSLKKIEIEMHIPHKEMEIDWSKPLPESEWERLAQYCENDVLATEAYFLSKKFQADFKARKILAALTGMTVNDSTNNLVAQLIFGDVREPWHEFVYPDLKKEFPEYRFEFGKSYYGDELIGEGGRVYAEPGMYYHVITFDVASMHPTSIIVENGFGPYTKGYKDLYEARIAIKHKDYDKARKLFNGRLAPYLENDEDADDLAYALKIALNSTYGMTAASFQNRFKDPRNIDNWVAKRGALFMEKLRREVQARGGKVIHIKTDSIKLVDPSKDLENFVIKFGKEHGYNFEIESRYERICLVNHAVYIALRQMDDPDWLKECAKAQKKAEKEGIDYIPPTRWTATGAQFAHPFVFKRLFSHEPMEFWDFCETKTVKTALYLDLNEKLKDVTLEEKDKKKIQTRIKQLLKARVEASDLDREKIDNEIIDLKKDISVLDELIAEGHAYTFVGKAGEFIPVKDGLGGGLLMRSESTGGYGYAANAKGYRWLESETIKEFENWKHMIEIRYFKQLTDEAIETINKFGDFELFAHEEKYIKPEDRVIDIDDSPWNLPCGSEKYAYCSDCPEFSNDDNKFGYCCKLGYNIENQILVD